MTEKHSCVAIYEKPALAEEAISRLQEAGFDKNQLSLVGRDTWASSAGSYDTGGGFRYCGTQGIFWEKLWSILLGRGVFWFYADGPMLVAGPLVGSIVAAQGDGHYDSPVAGFTGGLAGLGIPEENIAEYEAALKNDRVLLFVLGSLQEIDRADKVLTETQEINHTLHHATVGP